MRGETIKVYSITGLITILGTISTSIKIMESLSTFPNHVSAIPLKNIRE